MRLRLLVTGLGLAGALGALGPACALDWDPASRAGGEDATRCDDGATCSCTGEAASCTYAAGTGSTVTCGGVAFCTVACTGSDCKVRCENASQCELDCPGGGCTLDCGNAGICTSTCPDGTCKKVCASGSSACE
jgi:hypothetical protein